MSKRKEDRQQQILRELAETPTLRIGDMARTHGVSTETIRRDLDELTRRGVLNRTYGGAVRAMNSEPTVTERHQLFTEERERIA
ncbi:DeoR family transcriptional regulator, partial [Klebsiella pneumoniae]